MSKPAYKQHTYKTIPVVDSREGLNFGVTSIRVDLTYSDGSMGGRKGFSLHAQPMEERGTMETYSPREGLRMLVRPVARFSAKQARLAVVAGEAHVDAIVEQCLAHNDHLTLAPDCWPGHPRSPASPAARAPRVASCPASCPPAVPSCPAAVTLLPFILASYATVA